MSPRPGNFCAPGFSTSHLREAMFIRYLAQCRAHRECPVKELVCTSAHGLEEACGCTLTHL